MVCALSMSLAKATVKQIVWLSLQSWVVMDRKLSRGLGDSPGRGCCLLECVKGVETRKYVGVKWSRYWGRSYMSQPCLLCLFRS